MPERAMRIGEVADLTGLSLRSIRKFDELGLVRPSGRSPGGFRLYSGPDLTRLRLVMDMKPLGFSYDEMRELLGVLDGLEDAGAADREQLARRLDLYAGSAESRCATLRLQLRAAESFSRTLTARLPRRAGRD